MIPVALSEGDAFLIVVAIAVPIAAIAFAAVGPNLRQLGKGRFAVQYETDIAQSGLRDSAAEDEAASAREAEIRQLVEAKAYRQSRRGERPLDVEAEVGRLLEETPAGAPARDDELIDEVRQIVIAANERRARRGESALDVEEEVERRLSELEDLGQ